MQPLLDLLRGQLQDPLDDDQWSALLEVAEREDILPWTAECLRLHNPHSAPGQKQRLDVIRREAHIATLVWTQTLRSTLAAFRQADLPAISLKGPCLAERLYGHSALRPCFDLDLLVRPSDLARARGVLSDIGFEPYGSADDYHSRWLRHATILELHQDLENPHAFLIDMDALWERSHMSLFQGEPIQLLGPSDELLYLCLHAVRHRFERLRLVLDLAFAFRRIPLPPGRVPGWDDPVFNNTLALGSLMAARLDSGIPMPQGLRMRPRDRKRLELLADRIWHELMLQPAPVLDWSSQHRFFLEVENPGARRMLRRWRHLRILATRLIDVDFAFAERLRLHRNWQVRLLRPLRLLIKAMTPSPRMW